MGELIKNGISYTTTTNDALSIDYDNKDSGLEANNVQDAVDELNSNLNDINNNLGVYSGIRGITFPFSSYTVTNNMIINCRVNLPSNSYANFYVNDIEVASTQNGGSGTDIQTITLYAKKGDIIKYSLGNSATINYMKAYNFKR